MKPQKRTTLSILLILLLLFVGIPGGLIYAAFRQNRLDRALIAAIKAGNDTAALDMLRSGADPNSQDISAPSAPSPPETFLETIKRLLGIKKQARPSGPAALMLAVAGNHSIIVQALLDRDAKGVNATIQITNGPDEEPRHLSLLLAAAKFGDEVMVRALLDKGADIHAVDDEGATALILALSNLPDLDAKASAKQKADAEAARKECTAIVRLLLERGVNINAQEKRLGETALQCAVDRDAKDIVQALLNKGADPNIVDSKGSTALDEAAGNGNIEMMRTLLHRGAHINPHNGADPPIPYAQDADTLRFLVAHGADIHARLQHGKAAGETALIAAARGNDLKTMRLLLSLGADVNETDLYGGDTALILAAEYGDATSVKYLIGKGANINAKGDGFTALTLAAAEENKDNVLALLDAGANPNIKDGYGRTALMIAADDDMETVAETLLKHRARVDLKDHSGLTALMYAADSGNDEIVEMLLEAGARVNARDKQGDTALDYANEGVPYAEWGESLHHTITLLEKAGARP